MDEKLLQYIWKYRLFNSCKLQTVEGEAVDILSVGEENSNSGPDFLRAKIRIAQTLWAGSVELHIKSSDWNKHRHSQDNAYNNVVLHVVYQYDVPVCDKNGVSVPTLELKNLINASLITEYRQYMESSHTIVCQNRFAEVDSFRCFAWLDRLMLDRLEKRTQHIENDLKSNIFHKEEVFYHIIAKAFGFKTNAEPMLMVAKSLNLNVLAKQKDSLLQIEALFLGQAGLLEGDFADDYPQQLQKEYRFLQAKFKLQPACDYAMWHWARLYPSGQPHIRLVQMAALVHQSTALLSKVLEINTIEGIERLFSVTASAYWDTHFRFDVPAKQKSKKKLGKSSVNSLIINAILPFLFAYASWQNDTNLKNKVITLYESIPLENNRIVKYYTCLRKDFNNALQSQALIQLYESYCKPRHCLQCGIGIQLLKN